MTYLTFAEYTELGGTVTDESIFTSLQRQIESKLNYFTFGRIEALFESGDLPSEVELLEVELINMYSADDIDTIKTGVQSYSNGIESITYATGNTNFERQRDRRTYTKMQAFLWKYPELFYRGRG